jgi:hypothetical protein
MKTIVGERHAMVSRLFLVAMVTASGLSITGWMDCRSGFNAFRYWAIARLADWDARSPVVGESIRVAEEPVPARLETRLVAAAAVDLKEQTAAPASPPEELGRILDGSSDGPTGVIGSSIAAGQRSRNAVAFAPIAVEGDLASGVGDERDRKAGGLETRGTTPVEAESRIHRGSVESYDPVSTGDLTPAASDRSVDASLAMEFCKLAEASPPVDPTRAGPEAVDPGALHAGDPSDDVFDEDPAGDAPSGEGIISDGEPPRITMASGPGFEPYKNCDWA